VSLKYGHPAPYLHDVLSKILQERLDLWHADYVSVSGSNLCWWC